MPTPAAPPPSETPLQPTAAGPVVDVRLYHDFPSAFLDRLRDLHIYLPPGYTDSGDRRYPVLYANDGQDLGTVHLRQTLENLYAEKAIEPLIVVGISASEDRLHEYGVAGQPNADGLGAQAGDYRRFVLEELLPFIESNYRVESDPARRAIMGWSLGGLSAFDLAWNQPQQFGIVGVFSGSFWWRSDDSSLEARLQSRIAHQMVRSTALRPALRFWFEVGGRDETSDRDGDGIIDAIQDTTELIDELARLGYDRAADIRYVELPQGQHNLKTWAEALPLFLEWAFPARP